ncbi:hypothetical protein DPMN_010577 [Dreissena polymorpha]|uniref:Uncharacterized protein n=1 Tax=Dreissena polymorpha TaxID=45954 RepID=A0A9D4N1R7_DREPO|nr:hypothetical protein DPMN_010577 [Dreissena polymorpha]
MRIVVSSLHDLMLESLSLAPSKASESSLKKRGGRVGLYICQDSFPKQSLIGGGFRYFLTTPTLIEDHLIPEFSISSNS